MILGIGTDIVLIDRIRQALSKQAKFKGRLYTEREQAYCDRQRDSAASYAARFAAKEAVAKALGTGIGHISWLDIEVIKSELGVPQVNLHGKARELQQQMGFSKVLISLSHCRDYATAYAMIEGDGGGQFEDCNSSGDAKA